AGPAKAVDVRVFPYGNACHLAHLFWSGIVERTRDALARRGLRSKPLTAFLARQGLRANCQAKVNQLHLPPIALSSDQDICRLDVPVKDSFCVSSLQSFYHRQGNREQVRGRQRPFRADKGFEIRALE